MNATRLALTLLVAAVSAPCVVQGQWYSFSSLFVTLRQASTLISNTLEGMLEQDVDQQRASGPFPCDVSLGRSDVTPNSVHRLRPGDFKVIGALGDSLTVGFGMEAKSILDLLVSYRGRSWAAGGEGTWRDFLTLPNILKAFNPSLVGYSNDDLPMHKDFNVAYVGAKSVDLISQARILVDRVASDPRINFQHDWKMITINIGHNDFCTDMCVDNTTEMLNNHTRDFIEVLDYLQTNLPRTFVSIVLPANVSALREQVPATIYCHAMRSYACPCVFNDRYASRLAEFSDVMSKWQQLDHQVASRDRYNSDDFAVVVQPFTQRFKLPVKIIFWFFSITDPEFYSSDCFHFSQKTNAHAAVALWNNLLQPVGEKSNDGLAVSATLLCPTKEHPYIYTKNNS